MDRDSTRVNRAGAGASRTARVYSPRWMIRSLRRLWYFAVRLPAHLASVSRFPWYPRSATVRNAWASRGPRWAPCCSVPASHPPGNAVEVRESLFHVPAGRANFCAATPPNIALVRQCWIVGAVAVFWPCLHPVPQRQRCGRCRRLTRGRTLGALGENMRFEDFAGHVHRT